MRIINWTPVLAMSLSVAMFVDKSEGQSRPPERDSAFTSKAERLERTVMRRPRAGAALDLWLQHYDDAGRRMELLEHLGDQARNRTDDVNAQIVWGLVSEKLRAWSTAEDAYRAATLLAPDEYYAHSRFAEVLLRRGKTEQAAHQLEIAVNLTVPRVEYLKLARQLALLYDQLGQLDKSAATWIQIGGRFSRDPRVTRDVATRLQRMGKIQPARQLWQTVSRSSRDLEARFHADWQLALLSLHEGETEAALRSFSQLLDRVEPNSWRAAEIRRTMNQTLIQQGGPSRPVEYWRSQLDAHPADLTIRMQLADALANNGAIDESIRIYQDAIARASEREDLRRGLIRLLTRNGDHAGALKQLENLAETRPGDSELLFELGRLRLQQTQISVESAQTAAIDTWRRAVEGRPDDAAIALRAAETCRRSARTLIGSTGSLLPNSTFSDELMDRCALLLDAAESFYREAVQREPTPQNLEYLGEFLYRMRRDDEAVETWRGMARDGSAAAWRQTSQVLKRYRFLPAARDAARSAVALHSADAASWRLLLEIELTEQDYDSALETIERMLVDRPGDLKWKQEVWQSRATTIIAAGRIDEYIKSLTQQLADAPNDVGALVVLAALHEANADSNAAIQTYRQLVDLVPNDPVVARSYADSLISADDRRGAIVQLYRLIDLPQGVRSDDYHRLIELLLRVEQSEEAATIAERLVQKSPRDAESYLLMARVAEVRQITDVRLSSLQRAIDVAPNDVQALRQYAQALVDTGRSPRAMGLVPKLLRAGKTLPEKIAVVAWTLSWATSEDQHRQFERDIQELRLEHPESTEQWSECLIHLFQGSGQSDRALAELEQRHRRLPNDPVILKRLVGMAEAQRHIEIGVRYQEKVVRLDRSADAQEKLARLYRQAGRVDQATEIWNRLLEQPMSEDEAIRLVDQQLLREDLYAAQRLAESGLSHYPDNRRLAFRAGLLHLATEQFSAARDTFESIVSRPSRDMVEPSSSASGASVDHLETLSLALTASRFFNDIAQRRDELGARHPRTLQQFSKRELLETAGESSPLAVAVFSAVACLDALPPALVNLDRLEQQAESSSLQETMDAVMAATWATQHYAAANRLADSRHQADADHPLPHWVRLLTPPPLLSNRPVDLVQITASFEALRRDRPADDRRLHRLYVEQLANSRTAPGWSQIVAQQIQYAPDIVDLVVLGRLFDGDPSTQRLVESFVDRIRRLGTDETSQAVRGSELRLLLGQLVRWDFMDRDTRVALVAQWLPRYLLSAMHERLDDPRSTIRAPSGLAKLQSRLAQSLEVKASRALLSRVPAALPTPSNTDSLRRQLRAGQKLLQMLQADSTHTYLPDGSVVVTASRNAPWLPARDEPLFPAPSFWVDRPALASLREISEFCDTPVQQQMIIGGLRSAMNRRDKDPAESRMLRVAIAALVWWWNRPEEAIGILRDHADDPLADFRWMTLLLRAEIEVGQLEAAQTRLNRLLEGDDDPDEIVFLQNELATRWTAQTHWRDLTGHEGAVSALATDPQGRYLASGGVDGRVRLWDVRSGESLRVFDGHDDIVLAAAFSPDGSELATAGYDRTIRRWRIAESGGAERTLTGHASTIRTLQYSPDGNRLLSGGDDRSLIVWDLSNGRPQLRLRGHAGPVLVARYLPGAEQIVSSGSDQTLRWWRAKTGELTATAAVDRGVVRGMTMLNETGQMISAGDTRVVQIWDPPVDHQADEEPETIFRTDSAIGDLARCPTHSVIAIGRDDHWIQLLNTSTKTLKMTLNGHAGRVLTVVWSPTGNWLASAGFDGTIKLWRPYP